MQNITSVFLKMCLKVNKKNKKNCQSCNIQYSNNYSKSMVCDKIQNYIQLFVKRIIFNMAENVRHQVLSLVMCLLDYKEQLKIYLAKQPLYTKNYKMVNLYYEDIKTKRYPLLQKGRQRLIVKLKENDTNLNNSSSSKRITTGRF